MIGKRFGRLLVLEKVSSRRLECICDCGNKSEVDIGNLRYGRTRSCGCLLRESLSSNPRIKKLSDGEFFSFIKADSVSGCWLWLGATDHRGYGRKSFRSETLAHRGMMAFILGCSPKQWDVLHSCDNPTCVNPFHLRTGTAKDNRADCISRGRHNSANGERVNTARLTEDDVRFIRTYHTAQKAGIRVASGTLDFLVEKFQVHKSTIVYAINRTTWKHLA